MLIIPIITTCLHCRSKYNWINGGMLTPLRYWQYLANHLHTFYFLDSTANNFSYTMNPWLLLVIWCVLLVFNSIYIIIRQQHNVHICGTIPDQTHGLTTAACICLGMCCRRTYSNKGSAVFRLSKPYISTFPILLKVLIHFYAEYTETRIINIPHM